MANLLYGNQYFTTQLNVGGGIDASQTTGIIISDVSGIDTTKPGMMLVNYSEPLNTSLCEWIEYSSIDGSKELQGVIRGSEGFSAKSHDNEVSVAFPLSESHINRINDMLLGVDTGARINPKVTTTTDDATAVINIDTTDQYELSAIANATTFTISGTPKDGQKLIIRFKDAGVAKGLTFTGFTALGATIPTTTTAGKWGYVGAIYNLAATTWHILVVNTEA